MDAGRNHSPTTSSLLKKLSKQSHPERSGGGKAGAAQSKDPVSFRCHMPLKPDEHLLWSLFAISRDPSTPRRAAFARRGAPLRMTLYFGVFQQAAKEPLIESG